MIAHSRSWATEEWPGWVEHWFVWQANIAALVQQNGHSQVVTQSQPSPSLPAQHLPTCEMPLSHNPAQSPPSYEALPAVNDPSTYKPVPTVLTHLLTSSQGALLPTVQSQQLSLATSSAIFVPDVMFVSADGTAVTQSVTNHAASLPRPQFIVQPHFQSDVPIDDLNAFMSGAYYVCFLFTSRLCPGHTLLLIIQCVYLSVCLFISMFDTLMVCWWS